MATSLTMNDLSFYEPMRKNWFIVQFDSGLTDGQALTIACKTCDIPQLTTSENVIDRLNDKVYTAGKSEYNTISMSFYEYIKDVTSNGGGEGNTDQSAGAILYAWQQKQHNVKTGVQGAKKNTSKNVAIIQIDGNGNAVRVWNVYRAWPTTVEFAGLDSTDGGIQEVTLTLRYDWAEQKDSAINIKEGTPDVNGLQAPADPF